MQNANYNIGCKFRDGLSGWRNEELDKGLQRGACGRRLRAEWENRRTWQE